MSGQLKCQTSGRRNVLMFLVAGLLICGLPLKFSPSAFGQATAKPGGKDMIRGTRDNWGLHMTYFESSSGGKESPVAILVPGAEGTDSKEARTRRVWEKTALALQKEGYAVITVDLRKHGDSVPAADLPGAPSLKLSSNDYAAMAAIDLEAVKEFLVEEHKAEKLNIRKLGVVSAGSSGMITTAFAVADWAKPPYPDAARMEDRTPNGQDVRALVMLSPKASVKGINGNAALKSIKGVEVAVQIIASKNDKAEARDAEKIFKTVELKGDEYAEFRKLTLTSADAKAEKFLEGAEAAKTNQLIVEFLNKNLKQLDAPWKTRTSKLE